eukprot:7176369-Alexandrium_andersonii.AAC.1
MAGQAHAQASCRAHVRWDVMRSGQAVSSEAETLGVLRELMGRSMPREAEDHNRTILDRRLVRCTSVHG